MSWWKRPKCSGCSKKLKKGQKLHVLRLNTLDGEIEMEVCNECADFWDKSIDVFEKMDNDRSKITE